MLPLPGLNKQGRETWMLPGTPEVRDQGLR